VRGREHHGAGPGARLGLKDWTLARAEAVAIEESGRPPSLRRRREAVRRAPHAASTAAAAAAAAAAASCLPTHTAPLSPGLLRWLGEPPSHHATTSWEERNLSWPKADSVAAHRQRQRGGCCQRAAPSQPQIHAQSVVAPFLGGVEFGRRPIERPSHSLSPAHRWSEAERHGFFVWRAQVLVSQGDVRVSSRPHPVSPPQFQRILL